MEWNAPLTPKRRQRRLRGMLDSLDAHHRQAIDGQWSDVASLEWLLQDEVERRAQKHLALRLQRATLHTTRTLGGCLDRQRQQ